MALSKDPAKRANQIANLKRTAALTHGAFSEVVVRAARERYLTELAVQFPSALHAELVIQAGRLAKLEALAAYTDERGVIRHQRRGDVFPAAALEEKISSAYERQAEKLLAREQARPAQPTQSLADVIAELTAETESSDQDGAAGGERP